LGIEIRELTLKIKQKFMSIKTKLICVGGYGDFIAQNLSNQLLTIKSDLEIVSINTDQQSQNQLPEEVKKINLSPTGHGAGGKPEIAYEFAKTKRSELAQLFNGTDVIFLVAGLGKGTGSGAGLYIAELAKELGVFTVACLRTPEDTDGIYSGQIANDYQAKISRFVAGTCTISNTTVITRGIEQDIRTIEACYQLGNQSAFDCIRGLVSVIENTGIRNVDLEDFKATVNGRFAVQVFEATEVNTDLSIFDLKAEEARTSLVVIVNLPIS
jgi:cell division protein FtsZ